MRIDTAIPNTSWFTLGVDVPYRFAYRHIQIAFKEPDIGFFERITHITMSALLSIPVVGIVIVIAERLLFPPKKGGQVTKDQQTEPKSSVQTVKKIIRPHLILDLVDNKVPVESITFDELEEIADNGKLWSLLNQSKKKVSEIFTEKHFKILLLKAHISTLGDRIDTLKSIVELIPFDKLSQIEILKIICKHATPEMELVLQVKINKVRRLLKSWNKDTSIITELNSLMKKSNESAIKQRGDKEKIEKQKRQEQTQRTFKFHVPLPGEHSHQIPVNGKSPRSDDVDMSDDQFLELLKSTPEDTGVFQQKVFVYKLLQSYSESRSETKQKIEEHMKNGLESQLTTMAIMSETVSMHPDEIASLVQLLQVIDPSRIVILWDQLLKNKAAFLGEQGKQENALRIGAVFGALSDEQVQHSLKDKKFEIAIRDYPKEAAKHMSASHLDLMSGVIGPEALSELVPSLEENDRNSLYETLKIVCKQFPTHISSHQKKVAELDDVLKKADEQKNRQKYNLLKTKHDELKSQLITLERVLRVKIKKLGDETKSRELFALAKIK